jgi:tetratricopeptide (TPR) repeat protein
MKIKVIALVFFTSQLQISCREQIDCRTITEDYFSLVSNLKTKDDTLQLVYNLGRVTYSEPNCLKAVQLKGFFNIALEKYSDAKADFLKAFSKDTLNPFSNFYLGMLFNFEGKNDRALFFVERAKKYKESGGFVLNKNNDFSQNLDVNYLQINHFLGVVIFELRNFTPAKQCFSFCIENDYFGYDTFGYLAAIYTDEKNLDSACYFYKKAMVGGINNFMDSRLTFKCVD